MNFFHNIFLIIIVFLIFISCSKVIKEEAIKQRNDVKEAIIKSIPTNFVIHIAQFKNNSKDPDLDYITTGAPETLANYLKPIENETVFIPFESISISATSNVQQLITISNSIFSNYITNVDYSITQSRKEIVTNIIENITTNSNNVEITDQKKKLKMMQVQFVIITNNTMNLTTNFIVTNIIATNKGIVQDDMFTNLIINEFPDLTNIVSYMPISVQKDFYTTNTQNITNMTNSTKITNTMNTSTNLMNLNAYITGDFTVISKERGPNNLNVNIYIEKIAGVTNANKFSLQSREDSLSDNMYDFLKPLRDMIINKKNGDVMIITKPENANIYLDGVFIGKSPLYYPAVPIGSHQFTFLKEGYHQVVAVADINENITNNIYKSIVKQLTGGIVKIDSTPSNSLVFIDSDYYGITPAVVTNLIMDSEHRVKVILNDSTNYFPYFQNFTLTNKNQTISINAVLMNHEGSTTSEKKIAWWMAFGGWLLTAGFTGFDIYTDYKMNYYADQYFANPNDMNAKDNYNNYSQINQNAKFYAIASSFLVAMPLTAFALYKEEIFLGFRYFPGSSAYGELKIKY